MRMRHLPPAELTQGSSNARPQTREISCASCARFRRTQSPGAATASTDMCPKRSVRQLTSMGWTPARRSTSSIFCAAAKSNFSHSSSSAAISSRMSAVVANWVATVPRTCWARRSAASRTENSP